MKASYQIMIRLTEQEKDILDRIRTRGIKIVDIFRCGLGVYIGKKEQAATQDKEDAV